MLSSLEVVYGNQFSQFREEAFYHNQSLYWSIFIKHRAFLKLPNTWAILPQPALEALNLIMPRMAPE